MSLNADTEKFLKKEHEAAYIYIWYHAHTELFVGPREPAGFSRENVYVVRSSPRLLVSSLSRCTAYILFECNIQEKLENKETPGKPGVLLAM